MQLFKLILQLNSPIRKENKKCKNMYKGFILAVNDIKLDIFKKVKSFFS